MTVDTADLKQQYETIKQSGLDKISLKYDDISPLIGQLTEPFSVEQVGTSYQGRPLHKILIGQGPTRLFLWSQMHGNEPTATAALCDLMNFIQSDNDWFKTWQDKLTIQILPMVNPDGAQCHQRHNAQSIDINRDARALQSPEGQVLNRLADEFKPDYGFNLHDQNRYYTVTGSSNPTTISLLAPAFNEAKEVNESRLRAMRLGALFNELIQTEIPGCVGRYDDTYSYRSFGDNFAAKGIATLLIESGFSANDPTRQTARWLNFMMLVHGINSIASGALDSMSTASYDMIPMNYADGLVDLKLINVNVADRFSADISINSDAFFDSPEIADIGDISNQSGISEIDMTGKTLLPAKGYEVEGSITLTEDTYLALLRQGFSYFIAQHSQIMNHTDWPVVSVCEPSVLDIPQREGQVHMIFAEDSAPKRALIAGQWIEL